MDFVCASVDIACITHVIMLPASRTRLSLGGKSKSHFVRSRSATVATSSRCSFARVIATYSRRARSASSSSRRCSSKASCISVLRQMFSFRLMYGIATPSFGCSISSLVCVHRSLRSMFIRNTTGNSSPFDLCIVITRTKSSFSVSILADMLSPPRSCSSIRVMNAASVTPPSASNACARSYSIRRFPWRTSPFGSAPTAA